ncbi:hypothetical protein TRL7639_02597 [Falsiruegeria litorea R37]|uniref:Type IV pilus biogenesis n=1 Tax=Falsiruegeria litorea R37 TaxID=1200284 RepID=A0A1Y5SXN8_9RHOB|nr:hypothetical protein [Falsiruegeria litorea]SLN47471.1 hypothetical protein TRL7639_02597 [Falsiruegeria litorea R37]
MKPTFALSLSFEGISLLHRAAGGWRLVGDVDINDETFLKDLAALRDKALLLSPEGVDTKLILPNDQIRYLTVNTGSFEGETRTSIIESAVAEATPYGLGELVYDTSPDGHLTHIAIVARETLQEAEDFAAGNGFGPVSFVAVPGENDFLGEPYFGPTKAAHDLTGADAVEPDGIAVVVIGPAELPPVEPAPEPTPAQESAAPPVSETSQIEAPEPKTETPKPKPEEAAEVPPEPAPQPPSIGFASRRGKAPAPAAPKPVSTPEPKPAPEPEVVAFASKRSAPAPATAPAPAVSPPPPAAPEPIAPEPIVHEPTAIAVAEVEPVAGFAAPRLPGQQAETEKDRMTIFGARDGGVGGKPKYLGLMLTVALVLMLAAVATWAGLFSGIGLFDDRDTPRELTPAPVPAPLDPVQPQSPGTAPAQPDPTIATPPPTANLTNDTQQEEELASLPSDQDLTETDSAVLDALRVEPETVETVTPEDEADVAPEDSIADIDPIEGTNPETRYAATGIWDLAPEEPFTPSIIDLDDLYVASIDRTDLSQDAVALPTPISYQTDLGVDLPASPAAAGTAFALNDQGLVTPTPEGTLNPDGIMVFQGRPSRVPPAVPVRFETAPETDEAQERLAGLRPRLRPGNLIEQAERGQLGGRSLEELAGIRPKLRPFTEKQEAEEDQTPTALAIVRGPRPKLRPQDLAAKATRRTASLGSTAGLGRDSGDVGTVAPRTVKPKAPSPASVARQATLDNAINLRRVNLIGVYGTPANRRALVRLPSGRYKKVKVGDRVDGGRVVAIGDSELRYQKGGRNMTLKIPSG